MWRCTKCGGTDLSTRDMPVKINTKEVYPDFDEVLRGSPAAYCLLCTEKVWIFSEEHFDPNDAAHWVDKIDALRVVETIISDVSVEYHENAPRNKQTEKSLQCAREILALHRQAQEKS